MKALFSAAVLALVLGGNAYAQGQGPAGGPTMTFKQACSADVQKLCASAQTRKDQHMCLRQNKAQLSSGCGAFLAAKHAEKMQQQQGTQTAPAGGASH